VSVVAAMNEAGLLHHRIQFGSFNSELFSTWLTELGTVLLDNHLSECWLVLDNVRFHHTAQVEAMCTTMNHRLIFLPPYSPMLNPIELLFSKWKIGVKTSGMIYSRENLLAAIEESSQTITRSDCQGWIRESDWYLSMSLQRLDLE